MRISRVGASVAACWEWWGDRYEQLGLDAFIVMPNLLQNIVVHRDTGANARGGSRGRSDSGEAGSGTAPTSMVGTPDQSRKREPLGRLIAASKTVSTRGVNEAVGIPGGTPWHRNYSEHVIRNNADHPTKWGPDQEHPRFGPGHPVAPVTGDMSRNHHLSPPLSLVLIPGAAGAVREPPCCQTNPLRFEHAVHQRGQHAKRQPPSPVRPSPTLPLCPQSVGADREPPCSATELSRVRHRSAVRWVARSRPVANRYSPPASDARPTA